MKYLFPIILTASDACRRIAGSCCLQKNGKVVTISPEPEETIDFDYNQVVANNLKNRVYYDFHFNWDIANNVTVCNQWVNLFRTIFLLCCDEDGELTERDLRDENVIKSFLLQKWATREVNGLLPNAREALRSYLRMYIHKMHYPIPFRIILHNATSTEHAKCYLRHDNYFVEWSVKEEARNAVDVIRTCIDRQCTTFENRIFQNTETLTIFNEGRNSMQKVRNDLKAVLEFIKDHNLSNDKDKDQMVDKIIPVFEECSNLQSYTYSNEIKETIKAVICKLFPSELHYPIISLCMEE